MRRVRRLVLGGITAFALAFSLPTGASAAVMVDPAFTIIYVKGDAEPNQIHLDCRGGFMSINGVPAAEGRVSCSDLEKLRVFGFGGDDQITMTAFGGLEDEESSIIGLSEYDEYGEESPEISVSGGDGNDTLSTDGPTLLAGGQGDDILSAIGPAEGLMAAGPGNDRVNGGSLINVILGGRGNDRIQAPGLLNSVIGQGGADTLTGGRGLDLLFGGKGRDKLVGKSNPDLLFGAAGRDALFGGAAGDALVGGTGRDRLRGGPGKDHEFEGNLPRRRIREVFEILDPDEPQEIFRRFLREAVRATSALRP